MNDLQDFDFVCGLLDKFCADTRVRSVLKKIGSHDLTGWEKWIQVEFAIFLHDHDDVADFCREYEYQLDQRKANRAKAYADFSFRKKGMSKDVKIILEFKANRKLRACIDGMVADWNKIECVRASDDDIRSFWVVGFHGLDGCKPEEILKSVSQMVAEKMSIKLFKNRLKTTAIGKTGFAVTLF